MQSLVAPIALRFLPVVVAAAAALLHLVVVAPWMAVIFASARAKGVGRPMHFRPTDSFALARARLLS